MPDRIPFIDLHAHFPMHSPFPPIPFPDPSDNWKKSAFNTANALFNYEGKPPKPRVSLDNWLHDTGTSPVSGFGSILYDPEDDFFVKQPEVPIPSAYDHIRAQLANVEAELTGAGVAIARNPARVEEYLNDGQRFVFHTLEGGFSLGGDPAHVASLAALGIASITPAHLFFRAVSTCENGFPPLAEPLFEHEVDSQPNIGLTDLGKRIVNECFKHKVIVDITHARTDAQKDIFEIATGYPDQPFISSHNSVRAIRNAGLNLSDDVIRRIASSGGVVGVIFYRHWLLRDPIDLRSDVRLITDVIDHIQRVTGNYNNIAIGSDLDGFIEPIHLCSNYSKMSAIVDPLVNKYGLDAAKSILYRNALRVLYAGWTGVA
jgi:membrane dipeptidase